MNPTSFINASRAVAGRTPVNLGEPDIFVVPRDVSPQLLKGIHDNERVHLFSDGPFGNDMRTRLGHTSESQGRRLMLAWRDPDDEHGAFISVQAALTSGLAGNIHDVIAVKDVVIGDPDTVIFYSVSNWNRVSRVGEPFLNSAVEIIKANFEGLKHVATLSPMPEFRKWVANAVTNDTFKIAGIEGSVEQFKSTVLDAKSIRELQTSGAYHKLMSLAAVHILGGTQSADGKLTPYDKGVAGFHQGRGAVAERLCPEAYVSGKGFEQSFGIMVNYANLGNEAAAASTYKDGKPIIRPGMAAWLPPQEPSSLHKVLWLRADHN